MIKSKEFDICRRVGMRRSFQFWCTGTGGAPTCCLSNQAKPVWVPVGGRVYPANLNSALLVQQYFWECLTFRSMYQNRLQGQPWHRFHTSGPLGQTNCGSNTPDRQDIKQTRTIATDCAPKARQIRCNSARQSITMKSVWREALLKSVTRCCWA
jgi:hypothetical protein